MGTGAAGGGNIMFYVKDASSNPKPTDLETGTTAVFYIPFLVQSFQSNKDLIIPLTGADIDLNIGDTLTNGGDNEADLNPDYA